MKGRGGRLEVFACRMPSDQLAGRSKNSKAQASAYLSTSEHKLELVVDRSAWFTRVSRMISDMLQVETCV